MLLFLKSNVQIISDFDPSIDEQLVISTLLGLSEGDTMSERLGCFREKGEDESERLLISSKDASENVCEGASLEAKEKCEGGSFVSHDEILMQK